DHAGTSAMETSMKPHDTIHAETISAPDQPAPLDKDGAFTPGSGVTATPNYVVHTAGIAGPAVPDVKLDIHFDGHGLMLGHEWSQSSRGGWQSNFSWRSDGPAHEADGKISSAYIMSAHGSDAFHFELSSAVHEFLNVDSAQTPAEDHHSTIHI